jgi:hypothetical protein
VRRAVDDGYVLVTNNTTDFTSLLGGESVHAGLVCLNVAPGLMSLEVQGSLFTLALDHIGDIEPPCPCSRLRLTPGCPRSSSRNRGLLPA